MIRIGKLVATHGVTGSLIMTHKAGESNWLKKGHALMVEVQKGSFIPYFVLQFKAISHEEYIVDLEDVTSPQQAKKLVSRHVYTEANVIADKIDHSPLLWIGFTVSDAHYGNIGPLEDVMQAGMQWIGKLQYKGNEVLIPLVDATLAGLDAKRKILKTNLPEGLLEVYE